MTCSTCSPTVCEGTSPTEGMSLSFAASEALISTKAFVFLVTHFQELTQLEMYPNVEK